MCLTHSPFFIWQILMSVLQKPTTALSMRPALISKGAFAVCLWNVQKITASLEIRKYFLFKVHCVFFGGIFSSHCWLNRFCQIHTLLVRPTPSFAHIGLVLFSWSYLSLKKKGIPLRRCHVSIVCIIMFSRSICWCSLSGYLATSLLGGLHSASKFWLFCHTQPLLPIILQW